MSFDVNVHLYISDIPLYGTFWNVLNRNSQEIVLIYYVIVLKGKRCKKMVIVLYSPAATI